MKRRKGESMNATQLNQALKAAIVAGLPVMVTSPPGLGKSQIVAQVARETGRKLFDIRAALRQPVDFLGMPEIENGLTYFRPPGELPTAADGPCILFLDELPNAPLMVQSALLQLVLDRKLGAYTLPDDCAIIAAGNRVQDRAGSGRLIASLADRFIQLELEADPDAWVRWAIPAGIRDEVIYFIRRRPELLADIDPARNVNASPRSWEYLSNIIPHAPADCFHALASGIVGPGPAAEIAAFMAVYKSLPDPMACLMNPDGFDFPADPDVRYALTGSIAALASEQTGPGIVKVAHRFQREGCGEFGMLLMRDATVRDPAVCDNRDFQRWATDNNQVFTAA